MTKKKNDKSTHPPDIPDHVIESLARCVLPSIQAYFESEEGRREFEEWKRQKDEEKAAAKADSPD